MTEQTETEVAAPASAKSLPKYPNLRATLGDIPVVTTLLAAISAAVFLAPVTSDSFDSATIRPPYIDWTWNSTEAVLVLGALSTVLFVAASLAMIFAKATDAGSLSSDARAVVLDMVAAEKMAEELAAYATSTERWYSRGQAYWLSGLGVLALTAAALVWGYVIGLSIGLAAGAVLPSIGLFKFVDGKLAKLLGLVMVLVALAVMVTAIDAAR